MMFDAFTVDEKAFSIIKFIDVDSVVQKKQ